MTPVAIFTYNRPNHLEYCLNSLRKNLNFTKTDFYIFQDSLKTQNDEISSKYNKIFKKLPNNFFIKKRKKNLGLKKNIINGVSYLFKKYDKVIICEDDLVFHKDFIFYMNFMLKKYENKKKYLQ